MQKLAQRAVGREARNTCGRVIAYLVKVLRRCKGEVERDESIRTFLAAYEAPLRDYLSNSRSKYSAEFFTAFMHTYPEVAWPLAEVLLEGLNPTQAPNTHRLVQTFDFTVKYLTHLNKVRRLCN
jgi:hypothetical protein